jgi:hypothetical protein
MEDAMARISKVALAVAEHLGWDAAEIEDYRYQPGRTPCPIYAVGGNEYLAAAKRPPKTTYDAGFMGGWECSRWEPAPSRFPNPTGLTVYRAVF